MSTPTPATSPTSKAAEGDKNLLNLAEQKLVLAVLAQVINFDGFKVNNQALGDALGINKDAARKQWERLRKSKNIVADSNAVPAVSASCLPTCFSTESGFGELGSDEERLREHAD